jgi:hypothetical protein
MTHSLAIRCTICGAPAVLIDPGEPDETPPGNIPIAQGRPATGRCMAMTCWQPARGVQQALFAEAVT